VSSRLQVSDGSRVIGGIALERWARRGL